MSMVASEITGVSIACLAVCSGAAGDHFTKKRASFQSELAFTFATCDWLLWKARFYSQLTVFHKAKRLASFQKRAGFPKSEWS